MYLLVFVMLVIGLIGLYAQVLSTQTARMASNLTDLANTMTIWHSGAISKAVSDLDPTKGGGTTTPCSLTQSLGNATIPNCDGLNAAGTVTPKAGTVVDAAKAFTVLDATTGDKVHLPFGFNAANVQFNSILYTIGTINYVITYLDPPLESVTNPAPGYLKLPPTDKLISYTSFDLQHQLSISSLPNYNYGLVGAGNPATIAACGADNVLLSPAYLTGSLKFIYCVPAGTAPVGAIAIVSSTAGF